jgi:hypothetical protein
MARLFRYQKRKTTDGISYGVVWREFKDFPLQKKAVN